MEEINSSVVMFAREEDVTAAKYDKNYDNVINQNISLIDSNQIAQFINTYEILGRKRPTQNSVLIAHPYKNRCFVDIQESSDLIQSEKLNNTSNLAKLLGAKKFKVTSISATETEREFHFDADGSFKVIQGSIKVDRSISGKDSKKYVIERYFPGSEPNYQKASLKLKEFGLNFDSDIKELVESRNPEDGNLLLSQKLHLDLSSELDSSLDIAAGLTALKGALKINSSFKSTVSTRKFFSLVIDIEF